MLSRSRSVAGCVTEFAITVMGPSVNRLGRCCVLVLALLSLAAAPELAFPQTTTHLLDATKGGSAPDRLPCAATIKINPRPPDSLQAAFWKAFQHAFSERSHVAEAAGTGHDSALVSVPVMFRLVDRSKTGGSWVLRVALDYVPIAKLREMPVDNLRDFLSAQCAQVHVTVVVPGTAGSPSDTIASTAYLRVGEYLLGQSLVRGSNELLRDETPDWWRQLGRASALVALESLNHRRGVMEKTRHLVLSPVSRCSE